jgi:hypothetical protein
MSTAVVSVEQKSGTDYENVTVAKSEFYFVSVDSCLADFEDYKVQILDSGINYSFEIWLRFRCDTAPAATCSGFKIWTAGSLPSGIDITINTDLVDAYTTPVSTISTSGTRDSILNHTSASKVNVFGTLVNIGDKSGFIVLQLAVDDIAEIESLGEDELIIVYSYDEE